jgi:hypothetical protein
MAIIRYTKDENIRYAYLNIFPDQFKTEKQKQDESWIKNTMDYFANKAYSEYVKNRDSFVKNYDLLKGILRPEDFYQEPQVKTFTEMLTADIGLPSYVKHYSIMSTPLNNLVGEITKRPDAHRVKAFDDDSQSEELAFRTQLLEEFVISSARNSILEQAAMQGAEIDEEQLEAMTLEKVKDEIDNYTSIAEKWGNNTLTSMKAEFNLREKSEDAFRDMLITARERFHIYEDNSKLGFNIEVLNPKNAWHLTTPDRKYISDPSGRLQGAYAAGTVTVMEISEIIEAFPDITKDEIDHLRSALQDYGLINVRESNLGNKAITPGIDSVVYDTYDPLVLQERMVIESEMKENNDTMKDFLGLSSNVSAFGYKYVVVRAYWVSKKKIGKVVYIDELGNEQSLMVDENYKKGTIPTEVSVDWGWINQWYQGVKIGPDIYHVKPYDLLPYCPIIGLDFELKNTEAKSFVDMMKPFQTLYNVCMNQLFRLLEKEIGNVASVNIRRVPRVKDGDGQDDLDIWEMEARERGIIFDDDSPENTKAPVSNTSVARNIDLTRSNEIQSRYNLAIQLKNECWELAGITRQRLGSTQASETATGVNTAVTQSYAQTEPYFVAHEYIMSQLYQAILDAAQYLESQKDESTISYINSEGTNAFIQVNGTDLKLRDLKVFITNRPEDKRLFEELRMLAQPLLQNGGSFHDVVELYSTESVRQMKRVFKSLKEKQEEMQQQAMGQEQQRLDQEAQALQAQLEQQKMIEESRIINENYQNELDRINKKEIAIINATRYGNVELEDNDGDGISDILEVSKFANEQAIAAKDYNLKLSELANKRKESSEKMQLEREKLQVARENMKNDLQVAKENAKGRAKKASTTKKKK